MENVSNNYKFINKKDISLRLETIINNYSNKTLNNKQFYDTKSHIYKPNLPLNPNKGRQNIKITPIIANPHI